MSPPPGAAPASASAGEVVTRSGVLLGASRRRSSGSMGNRSGSRSPPEDSPASSSGTLDLRVEAASPVALVQLTRMGAKVEGDNYMLGYYAMADFNMDANGRWSPYHEEKTLNGHMCNGFMTKPANGYSEYDKEMLTRTMLEHEAIFRQQLSADHYVDDDNASENDPIDFLGVASDKKPRNNADLTLLT
ncbi:hypothetical protein E2562_036531 [Oryza meyeriana var. granulata]|uniref:Uncharacterized protein n=1 Tax=Oryza meyeriana var. granulata TaxID=110450 RepID=A0A6G1DSL4_9ORYZ|nr:hypothetical protein E2562_036531 [Oryza meyeriana var. granulata]